jgi:hypothetical protein
VLYGSTQPEWGKLELYLVDVSGAAPSAPLKVNAPLPPLGGIYDEPDAARPFLWSPNGSQVVYKADQDANEVYELYVVDLDCLEVSTKISGALAPGGDIWDFVWEP